MGYNEGTIKGPNPCSVAGDKDEWAEPEEVWSDPALRAPHATAKFDGLGVQIPWLGVKGTARNRRRY